MCMCVCVCVWLINFIQHKTAQHCKAAIGAYSVAQQVKNLPAKQETVVLSLGQEDCLEEEMATHSSILAWRMLWTEETCGLQSMGSQSSDTPIKK